MSEFIIIFVPTNNQKMDKESKIEQLYEAEKSRGFVNHLIHAYLPISKTTKVWTFMDNKKTHRCSVCNALLIDINTVFNRMRDSEKLSKFMVEDILNNMSGKEVKPEDRFMVKHVTHGAVMAWTGEKTTTHLCQTCVQELFDLVTTGLMMGDKNIVYQVNKIKRSSAFDSFASHPSFDSEDVEKIKKVQKRVEKSPTKTATFGDLEVLQNLKKKMESEE